ncbi:MAG: flagellar basal body rod protein FlgB [Spirochaetaceae bacterium]|jgi:flagellar basal-body rod protein FlgB|nr:flagellar basal body rod protein FlgB [Spirochaetaceae bacterium]
MINNFSKTVDLLHRSLDAETVRREVIANNLANAEVKDFKRSSVSFESALKQALESEKYRPEVEMIRTDERHLSNFQPLDYRDVRPRRVLDYLTQSKANGNNVDPEEEFNLLVQNQMRYTLFAQSVAFEFGQINNALRS